MFSQIMVSLICYMSCSYIQLIHDKFLKQTFVYNSVYITISSQTTFITETCVQTFFLYYILFIKAYTSPNLQYICKIQIVYPSIGFLCNSFKEYFQNTQNNSKMMLIIHCLFQLLFSLKCSIHIKDSGTDNVKRLNYKIRLHVFIWLFIYVPKICVPINSLKNRDLLFVFTKYISITNIIKP